MKQSGSYAGLFVYTLLSYKNSVKTALFCTFTRNNYIFTRIRVKAKSIKIIHQNRIYNSNFAPEYV